MDKDLEIYRQEMRSRFAEVDDRIDRLWRYTTRQFDELHRDTTKRFDDFRRDMQAQFDASRKWNNEDLAVIHAKIEAARQDNLTAVTESRRAARDELRLFAAKDRLPA